MAIFDNPWGIDPGSITSAFFQDNPQAAYTRAMRAWGGAGEDTGARSDWFSRQYQRELNRYYSLAPELDPNTSFLDYLSGRGNALQQQYQSAGPRERGVNIGLYQRPTRWTF